jgi:hypothetical protein
MPRSVIAASTLLLLLVLLPPPPPINSFLSCGISSAIVEALHNSYIYSLPLASCKFTAKHFELFLVINFWFF